MGKHPGKKGTVEPQSESSQSAEQRAEGRERDAEREEELSQEITGNIGSQSRNILGYTHAAGG